MADKKSLQMTERQGWNVAAQNQGLIQYQEAPNSQLRAEFLPSLVPRAGPHPRKRQISGYSSLLGLKPLYFHPAALVLTRVSARV